MTSNYTFGIEEEFFVVDATTLNSTVSMPATLLGRCQDRLGDRVALELLQSQLEIRTSPHTEAGAALDELEFLRAGASAAATEHGLAIIAAGTHPFADWQVQRHSERSRYRTVMNELRMLGHRNLLCGLHVHVGLPDPDRRVPIMTRMLPFLPLLLALSTSSPFWTGRATGMLGYRMAAYDELPRTGMPPILADQADYDRYVAQMTGAGLIPDASYLWWAIRPSAKYPTLELRVTDSCTSATDALAIAVLYRLLVHRLDRQLDFAPPVDAIGRSVAEECRWRVQRDGLDARVVDPCNGRATTAREAIERLVKALAPDARVLGHGADLARIRAILDFGTSAHRQLEIYDTARESGMSRLEALRSVATWLKRTTTETEVDALTADFTAVGGPFAGHRLPPMSGTIN
ncbi:MAG: carboxylate-amine ligase [Ancalomicrobiaceae bacterium]|nr:carboxylate-amine ligase [Ancalomicrobiaceae bacterium]